MPRRKKRKPIADGDWKSFRQLARFYQRELRSLYKATACDADLLRRYAKRAADRQRGLLLR